MPFSYTELLTVGTRVRRLPFRLRCYLYSAWLSLLEFLLAHNSSDFNYDNGECDQRLAVIGPLSIKYECCGEINVRWNGRLIYVDR